MYPTQAACRHQQQRVQDYRLNSDSYRFFNLLTSDALLDPVEAHLPEHRERLYPPTETLSLFLAQVISADGSCQNTVNQAAVQRIRGGLSVSSTRTGGYCRARLRLPIDMISGLARCLGEHVDRASPDAWCWQGRAVKIVDGTTVTMPDTAANQATYPQLSSQQAGLGFPLCRLVGITSLASGALLNAAIGRFKGKGGDEQTLLRSIQDSFEMGDIVLADAYFATYFFLAAMQAKGVDVLMEQHGSRRRKTDFRRGRSLGPRDHVIELRKPATCPAWMSATEYAAVPEHLSIRELKTGGKLLVTTMLGAKQYPKEALQALYKSRWHVELDLRAIKDVMGMSILRCKTPAMAAKEIWVTLLAYNLIRLMMAQSALLADTQPREISFKHCLQLWAIALPHIDIFDTDQLHSLLLCMAQQRVGNRPGRVEPRAVKRRPKAFPLLTKPRASARADVKKYGHPKKLK